MSGMGARLFARIWRERFNPSWLGVFVNPYYIMRRGLWTGVAERAGGIAGRVLDLGCGSKPYESLFAAADSYTGLDIEVSGHDHTQSSVDVFYDGKTIPFADGYFDAVLSFETFEHIFNLEDMLTEIGRVLRDGGKLLFTVPFAWPEHEEPYDFGRYTSFGMQSLLERHGFRTVRMDKSGSFIEAVFQVLIGYLVLHIGPRKSRAGRVAFCAVVIAPIALFGLLVSAILPRRYDFFCSLIVLAEKNPAAPGAPALPVDPRRKSIV